MRTHEQMPLVDAFGRSVIIGDLAEHEKHWLRAERRKVAERFQAIREEIHALKVRRRELDQLDDARAREQKRAS